jgi:hypothetical protein
MFNAAAEYFCRADWGFGNASRADVRPQFKSYLTAFAIHACDSLLEELNRLVEQLDFDPDAAKVIKALPHAELITNLRNHDLHGWPLPICEPGTTLKFMASRPDQNIALTSSNGVGMALTMDGCTPKVIRLPNIRKHAKYEPGGGTISCSCVDGNLIAFDFSTTKEILVLEAIKEFLLACHPLLNTPQETADGKQE